MKLIERDSYDEDAWERALLQHPELPELLRSGAQLMPAFEDLGQDLFALLYKYNVVRNFDIHDDASAREHASRRFAEHILGWVSSSAGFDRLKAETTLDETRAAFASVNVTRRVVMMLKNQELFSGEELLDAFELETLESEIQEQRENLETTTELLDTHDIELSNTAREALEAAQSSLNHEISELKRDMRNRAEQQIRRIDNLPARVESDIRNLIDNLPERMDAGAEAAEQFGLAMGGALGADTSAALKLELGEQLLTHEKLARLAALVGAFRQYALGARHTHFERRPSEVHAVDTGADLSRILPSELAQLSHPLLRRDVLRRFVDGQLLQYQINGNDRAGRGPMVVCLDGSHSMQGPKELWGKAVCLTLVELCRRRKRAFKVVVFSGHARDLRTFDLLAEPNARTLRAPHIDLRQIMAFADYFPRGGTRFEEPLDRAVELLSESHLQRGDIVLVTDGESQVSTAWAQRFRDSKKTLGCKLYSVLVDMGSFRSDTLTQISDRITSVRQLTAESAREIFLAV